MGFEVFTPKLGSFRGLERGTASINSNGLIRFHGTDLREAGITSECALLVDKLTHRIAVRAPRGEKDFREPTVKIRWAKSRITGGVVGNQALKEIGLPGDKCSAIYTCAIKDGMLIVSPEVQSAKVKKTA